MIANNLRRAVYALLVLPVGLTSQVMRQHDPAPLKHWAAPLYWHPSQPEANALAARPEAAGTTPEVNTQVLTSPLIFVGMTPCRVVDTRTGSGFGGSFGPPMLVGGGRPDVSDAIQRHLHDSGSRAGVLTKYHRGPAGPPWLHHSLSDGAD